MFQDITLEEWISMRDKKEFTLIDVRSPSEFEEATIPESLLFRFSMMRNAQRLVLSTSKRAFSPRRIGDLKSSPLNFHHLFLA